MMSLLYGINLPYTLWCGLTILLQRYLLTSSCSKDIQVCLKISTPTGSI